MKIREGTNKMPIEKKEVNELDSDDEIEEEKKSTIQEVSRSKAYLKWRN